MPRWYPDRDSAASLYLGSVTIGCVTARIFSAFLLCLLTSLTLTAGICSNDSPRPRHEVHILAGYSPTSPTLIGTARDFKMTLIETGYSYRCREFKGVGISYLASVQPMVLFHAPAVVYVPALPSITPGGVFQPTIGILPQHTTYGFGVMPLGFRFDFVRRRRLHPIAEINGGIVASTSPVPYSFANATGLNFLFNFGGGLRWHHKEGQAITAGYRFVHVSNAGTSAYNPGLDNNLFYLSYSFLR